MLAGAAVANVLVQVTPRVRGRTLWQMFDYVSKRQACRQLDSTVRTFAFPATTTLSAGFVWSTGLDKRTHARRLNTNLALNPDQSVEHVAQSGR